MSVNNHITLMGRLTRDPDIHTTQNGKKVCSFSVAVDNVGKAAGAEFIPCTAWENRADFIAKYFTKGSRILLSGSLHIRSYEDKEGNKRSAPEVWVEDVTFCENKNAASNEVKQDKKTVEKSTDAETVAEKVDGELPF